MAFIFLTRHWDVETYGQYALIKNWVAIFATFSDLGLNALTIREVARRKNLAGFYLRNVMGIRSIFSMVLVALLAVIGTLLHYEPLVVAGLVVMGIRLMLDCVSGGYVYLLQAHEKMGVHGSIVVAGSVIRLLGIVTVIFLGGGLLGACAAWGLASLFALAALAMVGDARGWRPDPSKWKWAEARKVLGQALPLAAFWSLQTLYYRVDAVILKSLQGNEAVGFYDAAYTYLDSVLRLSMLFGLSTFPIFAAARDNRADFSRILRRAFKLLLFLGIPITVGGALLASPLIVLFSTEKYLPSGPLFSVLVLSVIPFFISNLYVIVLTVKQPWILNRLYFSLLALNVGLNFALIPIWGAVGAAWATVTCEWMGLGVGLWTIRKYLGKTSKPGLMRPTLIALGAALVMGLGIHWDARLYWLALGPIIYGALLILFKALDEEDLASLKSVFRSRGPRTGPTG